MHLGSYVFVLCLAHDLKYRDYNKYNNHEVVSWKQMEGRLINNSILIGI